MLAQIFFLAPFGLLPSSDVQAGGYPWKDHARSYDFLFGNSIDTHQQSRVQANGDLFGFPYFRHFGEDILVMPGIDIATHVNIVGSFPPP